MEQAYMNANHSVSEMNPLNVVQTHAKPIIMIMNVKTWSRASTNMVIGGAFPVMADVRRTPEDYDIARVCS